MQVTKTAPWRLGTKVILGLFALTAVEFWVASLARGPLPYPPLLPLLAPITWVSIWVSRNPLPYLAVAALLKGVLILYYFMHVSHMWKRGH